MKANYYYYLLFPNLFPIFLQKTAASPIKNDFGALAGVVQWTECWPVNQRVAGLTPSQGICLS